MKIKNKITAGVLAGGGALLSTLMLGAAAPKSHDAALLRGVSVFNGVVSALEQNYVDTIRLDESFKAAIEAFLATTDPYTEFYDPEDTEKLQRLTTGEYGGIGSLILERNGRTYVSQPLAGSPAQKAGLRPGDHIIKVDTVDTSNMKSEQVTKYLKGVPGTKLKVTVNRPYVTDSILTFNIVRGKVQEQTVPYDTIINNVGYLRISSFVDKTGTEARTLLEKMKQDKNLKGIVLDLRGNGGGVVDAGISLLGNFVPKGTEVVRTVGRDPKNVKIYKTTEKPIFPELPLVVMIDGGTASTSEIVSGALQDLDRAVLIGSRSFGKGLVQAPVQLPYRNMLKVTTAKYYLPSGRLIQALDYSRCNKDGEVERIPDSLTNVFKTAHGREVRDGGGLRPDTAATVEKVNRLVYNIVVDNWAFDYANRYAATHTAIAPAWEFTVTDEIFDDFKKSIDPKRFKYDRVMEEMMKQIRSAVEAEGYMDDATKEQLDKLSKTLTHDLNRDLDRNRKQISGYVGGEIAERYYGERGRVAYTLQNDPEFKLASAIISSPAEYSKILAQEFAAATASKSKAKGKNGKK